MRVGRAQSVTRPHATLNSRQIDAVGASLCTECIGNPGDRPILPTTGAMASTGWWQGDFWPGSPPAEVS